MRIESRSWYARGAVCELRSGPSLTFGLWSAAHRTGVRHPGDIAPSLAVKNALVGGRGPARMVCGVFAAMFDRSVARVDENNAVRYGMASAEVSDHKTESAVDTQRDVRI